MEGCPWLGQADWKEAKKDGMRPLCRGTQVTAGTVGQGPCRGHRDWEEVGWGLGTEGPRQLEKRAPREGPFSHTHSLRRARTASASLSLLPRLLPAPGLVGVELPCCACVLAFDLLAVTISLQDARAGSPLTGRMFAVTLSP